MEEKKKLNWKKLGNVLSMICIIAIWVYSYISLCNATFTRGKLLALAVASFAWFLYYISYSLDPYLTKIEKLEEDKLELQAKMEQMKSDLKKKSTKTKKND
jgi:amino acid permease